MRPFHDGHHSRTASLHDACPCLVCCVAGLAPAVNGVGRDGYTPLQDSVLGGNLEVPLVLLR